MILKTPLALQEGLFLHLQASAYAQIQYVMG